MGMITDKLTLKQKQFVIEDIIDDVTSFYKSDIADKNGKIDRYMKLGDMTREQATIAVSIYFATLKDVKYKNEQSFYEFYKTHPGFNWPEDFKAEVEDKFVKNYWVIKSTDDNGFVKYTAYEKAKFQNIWDAQKQFDADYPDQEYRSYTECSKTEVQNYRWKSY